MSIAKFLRENSKIRIVQQCYIVLSDFYSCHRDDIDYYLLQCTGEVFATSQN